MGLKKAILLANLFRNVDTDEDTEYHLSDMLHILVVESYCYSGCTAPGFSWFLVFSDHLVGAMYPSQHYITMIEFQWTFLNEGNG
jgi:hypothetical protein